MKWIRKQVWSPYASGIIIGLLSWFAFLTVKPLGASTTFVRTAGIIERFFAPEHVTNLPYFIAKTPKIDWQWMLVLGILIGSFVSARLSGTFQMKFVPPMWQKSFGSSRIKRWAVAFAGGIVLMIGARMAGGCPTGHGLSGTLQLAVSGWIAVVFSLQAALLQPKGCIEGGDNIWHLLLLHRQESLYSD